MAAEPLNATHFWATFLSRARPLVLRGGAASVTDLSAWSDEALLQICQLEGGRPWHVGM